MAKLTIDFPSDRMHVTDPTMSLERGLSLADTFGAATIRRTIAAEWSTIVRAAESRRVARAALATLPKSPVIGGESLKTAKSEEADGVATLIVYLSPSDESGRDTCPAASAECRAACLVRSGQLEMSSSGNARLWKTALRFGAPALYFALLAHEIRAHEKSAEREGYAPAVRLDGTSDLGDATRLARHFPRVAFYDYTKIAARAVAAARGEFGANYRATFSWSGHNVDACRAVLANGGTVAVAFDAKPSRAGSAPDALPKTFLGARVIDGDTSDARYLDPRGVVVGLRFKGWRNRAAKIRAAGAFCQPVDSAFTRERGRALPSAGAR